MSKRTFILIFSLLTGFAGLALGMYFSGFFDPEPQGEIHEMLALGEGKAILIKSYESIPDSLFIHRVNERGEEISRQKIPGYFPESGGGVAANKDFFAVTVAFREDYHNKYSSSGLSLWVFGRESGEKRSQIPLDSKFIFSRTTVNSLGFCGGLLYCQTFTDNDFSFTLYHPETGEDAGEFSMEDRLYGAAPGRLLVTYPNEKTTVRECPGLRKIRGERDPMLAGALGVYHFGEKGIQEYSWEDGRATRFWKWENAEQQSIREVGINQWALRYYVGFRKGNPVFISNSDLFPTLMISEAGTLSSVNSPDVMSHYFSFLDLYKFDTLSHPAIPWQQALPRFLPFWSWEVGEYEKRQYPFFIDLDSARVVYGQLVSGPSHRWNIFSFQNRLYAWGSHDKSTLLVRFAGERPDIDRAWTIYGGEFPERLRFRFSNLEDDRLWFANELDWGILNLKSMQFDYVSNDDLIIADSTEAIRKRFRFYPDQFSLKPDTFFD